MTYEINSKILTDNSQDCTNGTLFLATQSSQKYADEARQRGAQIIYPQDLANYLRRDIKLIGITGTNGKTTTASMLAHLLRSLGHKVALQGTSGTFIESVQISEKSLTTPQLLDTSVHIHKACERGCAFFIMEVSSHAIAQERIAGLDFALKIITNITSDHLDYHKSQVEYSRIKHEFIANSLTLINADDKAISTPNRNIRSYAIESLATYKMQAYSQEPSLSGFISFAKDGAVFSSKLIGFFNLYNILASVGAAHILTNKSLAQINPALESFAGVAGRMEIVNKEPLVLIDFAHTQDGIVQALKALGARKIVSVVGAGGNRDKHKRPLMAQAAYELSKRVYFTSDNPRDEDPLDIIADMLAGLSEQSRAIVEVDRTLAIKRSIDELASDEVLIILGRGDETKQEVKGEFLPLNDKQIVLGILQ